MSNESGLQLLPFYPLYRGRFSIMPPTIVIDDDVAGIEAQFNGLDAAGLPHFSVGTSFTVDEDHAWHEFSHALERVLSLRKCQREGWSWTPLPSPSFDPRALSYVRDRFWSTRWVNSDGSWPIAVPATWDAELQRSREQSSFNAQWMYDPGEMWAEDHKNVMYGHFVSEKTMSYGIELTQSRIDALWESYLLTAGELEEEVVQTQIAPFATDASGNTPQNSPVRVTWDTSKLRIGKKVAIAAFRVGTTGIEPKAPGFLISNSGLAGDGTYQGGPLLTSVWIRGDFVLSGTAWGQVTLMQES